VASNYQQEAMYVASSLEEARSGPCQDAERLASSKFSIAHAMRAATRRRANGKSFMAYATAMGRLKLAMAPYLISPASLCRSRGCSRLSFGDQASFRRFSVAFRMVGKAVYAQSAFFGTVFQNGH
jgi:hypothetical protein